MGYHDGGQIPNYWAYAQQLRPPGPHVRARTGAGACRRTSGSSPAGRRSARDPYKASTCTTNRLQARAERAAPRAIRTARSTAGPTSPTSSTSTASPGRSYVQKGDRARLPRRPDQLLHALPQDREHARHLESARRLHRCPPGPPARQHREPLRTSTPRRERHPAQRLVGHARLGRQRPSRRADRRGAGVGDRARERRDEGARTGRARRSSSRGTTGAASTTTSSRRSSTRTATGSASPGS